jgi:xylulokinase
MGERSPHNDVNARACFIGMRPDTSRKQMTLAVMEGVAYALRDCIEVAKTSGLQITATKICGGGARSDIWKQVIANVFGIPVYVLNVEEGPAYGAAMLAMVGAKEYATVQDAAKKLVTVTQEITPSPALTNKYEQRYRRFQKLYPALKAFFNEKA